MIIAARSTACSPLAAEVSCQMLIDGLQTFQRMYEAILGASSSVSVLAWQINLDVGMVPTARVPHLCIISPLRHAWHLHRSC